MIPEAYAALVIGLLSYAAYLDVKTTEVPDWVSGIVAAAGILFHGYLSISSGSVTPLASSLAVGAVFFMSGWLMYLSGMWGGADAFVLGAVGFAFPSLPPGIHTVYTAPWPFPFSMLLTVFILGSVYSLIYAVYTAFNSEGFYTDFRRRLFDLDGNRFILTFYTALLAATMVSVAVFGIPLQRVYGSMIFLVASVPLLLILSSFLRTVESDYLEKEIPVEDLEEGDVLAEETGFDPGEEDPVENLSLKLSNMFSGLPLPLPRVFERYSTRVVGVTEEQVEELRDSRETVQVRTGVRFIPAFPAAAVLLLTVGDPFYLFLLYLL